MMLFMNIHLTPRYQPRCMRDVLKGRVVFCVASMRCIEQRRGSQGATVVRQTSRTKEEAGCQLPK
jgi:hypothetical protein